VSQYGNKGTRANTRELYALARQAGFSTQDAVTATAIALAESGGQTNSWNPVAPDDSYGPWQINRRVGPGGSITDARGTPDQLVNPQFNAGKAYSLFTGGGFCNWSTYDATCGSGHNGAYRTYLPEAHSAALEVQDTDVPTIVGSLMSRLDMTSQPGAPPSSSGGSGGLPPGVGVLLPGVGGGQAGAAAGASVASGHGFPDPLAAIAAPFAWLTVPGHWWAIAFVLLGLALAGAGLAIYFRPQLEQGVKTVAKVAAL
jgi:type II secretory pathway pseudopilin PulG